MGRIDVNFSGSIFRKDYPMVIATNRASAILNPVRLRYKAGGYAAGTVLARNTTDGWYDEYLSAMASGLDTAACVLFESLGESDFDGAAATGSTTAVGIFGGCTLYKDKMPNWDSAAETTLGAREIIDATGVTTIKF